MSWNLEGKKVFGNYLGTFPIEGIVTCSRVSYGGKVVNTIELNSSITVYGAEREVVIMDSENLTVLQ